MDRKWWDERYKKEEFAYGKAPNLFFKEWLPKFHAAKLLMPADGEGRNGVFAAQWGWEVTAFDLSEAARNKALELAEEKGVTLNYLVGDIEQLEFTRETFDAVGLIYAHVVPEKKQLLHQKIDAYLKVGGVIILEAFSKNHIPYKQQNPKVGGPADLAMLYSVEEIKTAFPNYEFLFLAEEEVELNEGTYHIGKGSVIRFVGRKK